jgi:hypothetical protein
VSGHRIRQPPDEPVGHTHRLPSWLIGSILVIGLGLMAGLVLVAEQSIATNNRLAAVEEYVAGKGQQRDAENSALNQRIDDAVCQVLDQLPAGAALDPVRAQYGCGPGLTAPAAGVTGPAATDTSAPARPTSTAKPLPSTDAARPTGTAGATTGAPSTTVPAPSRTPPATTATAPTSMASPTEPTRPAPAPSSTSAAPTPGRGPIAGLLCSLLPACAPT